MGIESTGPGHSEQQNKLFNALGLPKCDGRANFYAMWGHVGLRKER
jgi:hypothetical protein